MFDDIIADINSDNELNKTITKVIIRVRERNDSLVFISQSYQEIPKDVRLNTKHDFISEVPNRSVHQQININHSFDFNLEDVTRLYRKSTAEPYSIEE